MNKLEKLYIKNESIIILFSGLISYLYLFYKLVNNNFCIIILYFVILFFGYLIVRKKIYVLNLFIIIYDIIKTIKFREGMNWNNKENKINKDLKGNKMKLDKDKAEDEIGSEKKANKSSGKMIDGLGERANKKKIIEKIKN